MLPHLAKAFIRATARSLRYAIENPDEATTAFTVQYSKAYDKNFFKQQWYNNMKVLSEPGEDQLQQNDKAWSDILNVAISLGVIKNIFPVTEYYSNAYLSKTKSN